MNSGLRSLLFSAICGAFVVSASAAKLGDPAGSLTITDWVKGQPVDVTDGKNVYVVEFWATWCGPCKITIPQLTEMQKKYKDKGVVFVAISDEAPETVKPFVQAMGSQMDYIVACDTNRQTHAKYTEAYEQPGIPTAFIVNKEKQIIWFGHPLSDLSSTLDQVVGGTFDLAVAIKKDQARAAIAEYSKLSAMGDPSAPALGLKILNEMPKSVDSYVQFAMAIDGNQRAAKRDYSLAFAALDMADKIAAGKDARILSTRGICTFNSGSRPGGIALVKQAITASTDPGLLAQLKSQLQQMLSIEYNVMASNRDPKAAEFGKQLLNDLPSQADAYLQFAASIVNNQQVMNKDFALAGDALDRAEKLIGGKDARILNVRSICLYSTGKREAAIAAAKEAIEVCKDPQMLPSLQNLYRQLSMAEYNRMSTSGDPKAKALGEQILASLPAEVDPLLDFAFSIARNTQNKNRDFALALSALDRAEKLAPETDARILYLRALCLFDSGNPDTALKSAKQAVALCKSPSMLGTFQNLVQQIEAHQARNPAPAGNPAAPAPGAGAPALK